MSSEVEALFKSSGAILHGHFLLSSGRHSNLYLQCARLLQEPWKTVRVGQELARLCSQKEVDAVIAPALGGIIIGYELARQMEKKFVFTERKDGDMQLRRMFKIERGAKYLVVEDVVTTGRSSMEVARIVEEGGGKVAGFASLVDRSRGEHFLSEKPVSLLQVKADLFEPGECPLCRENQPLISPGSKQK